MKKFMKKQKKYFLLTFDIEKFSLPNEFQFNFNEDDLFEISRRGLENLILLLDNLRIKATFFVTFDFAKKYPFLIKELIKKNHEIAFHGIHHDDNYNIKTFDENYLSFEKAITYFNKSFGINILGFRSPRFHFIDYKLLNKLNLSYDSSIHPTFVPFRYFNVLKNKNITYNNNICEVPISVVPFLNMPYSWVWFRILPLFYSSLCLFLTKLRKKYIILYFHSWEFFDLKNYKSKNSLYNFLIMNSGDKMLRKFELFLINSKKEFIFSKINTFLKKDKKVL